MNEHETRPGSQYVYDRNPNYVPRGEPPSWIAGGKVVHVERVIFQNMPDIQTAIAALQAGEVDYVEQPPERRLHRLGLELDRDHRPLYPGSRRRRGH
jgi:peptide/nickel transport system substrate-binding protein